jgi:hypothetical protein
MKRRGLFVAFAPLLAVSCALVATPAAADSTRSCVLAHTQAQIAQHAGKLLAAREHLRACAQSTCPGLIVTDCAEWLDEVEKSIPSIVLLATDKAGTNLEDVKVSADGTLLMAKLDGRAVDVDPGTHTFRFEASDGRHIEEEALVGVGEKDKRVVVQFAEAPRARLTPRAPGPAVGPAATTSGARLRTAGLVAGAVGIIGLGVGAGFGVDAIVKQSDAHCPDNQCRPGSNPAALGDAQTAGTLSTVFFVAGGVLAASGILTWWLAPRAAVSTAWVRPVPLTLARGGGLGLAGEW